MSDKQKEIEVEESAKDIVRMAGLGVYEKAEYLYEQGYRKIPENAVVLTREEYEEQKSEYDDCFNELQNLIKENDKLYLKISMLKETTAKFAERLKAEAVADDGVLNQFLRCIDEICKEFTGDRNGK